MISLQPWWEERPGVLEEELQGFADRGLSFEPDPTEKAGGRIVLRGRAPVAPGEEQNLVIVYPDSFPHTRPAIFAPELDLERHQNPYGKNLCVLPRASIHWRPSMRAVDLVVDRVPGLVALVRRGGQELTEAEEPQGEPASIFLPYLPTGGFLVPEAILKTSSTKRGYFTVRSLSDDQWLAHSLNPSLFDPSEHGQAIVTHLCDKSKATIATAEERLTSLARGPRWKGRWIKMSKPPESNRGGKILEEAIESDPFLTNRSFTNNGIELLGITFPEEVRHGEWEDAWIFLIIRKAAKNNPGEHPIRLIRGMRYSPFDLAERIPELAPLREKTVSVIGLGALGSNVVHELARAQLGKLRLADHDHVEAATAVRWDAGLQAAGVSKPWAIKRIIEGDYPYVEVFPAPLQIGATPSEKPPRTERELIQEWLDDTDLVIDATAEQNVRRVVAHTAHPRGLSQIYLWSVDGYGGVVALLQPGRTGCLLCLERALSPTGGWIEPPSPAADPEGVLVQPRGCADRTFSGAHVDLVPLSTQATRFALSALCSDAEGGYPESPFDVLVCQLRDPDSSLTTPRWAGHQLEPNPEECRLCSRVS